MNNSRYQIRVGLASCGIAAGATDVYRAFQKEIAEADFNVIPTGCLGMCYAEPLVEVVDPQGVKSLYGNVKVDDVQQIIHHHIRAGEPLKDLLLYSTHQHELDCEPSHLANRIALRNCGIANPEDITSYLAMQGYCGLKKALLEMTPEAVIKEVEIAGLRGRGGAGFPTHLKWSLTRKAAGSSKYVVCNADEGDPGAFMDRSILESDPHSVLEGILLAGYAIGASRGYIYVRAEYPLAIKRLRKAIEQARQHNLLGENILDQPFSFDIEIREGAGAFVCGEETALLMSIEGKRGMPRFRPPYPAEKGLFGYPTSINNVETFANVPWIIAQGAQAFNQYGTEKSKGTKVFALAGKVKRGGLVEIPMGMTINELVLSIGGGISTGKAFKAIQTGGPSGGCIPADLGDTPVDYESLNQIGAIMGSGGLLVMDEDTCMVDVAQYFLTFAREESCGKCTFCRVGTDQMLRILKRITNGDGREEDLDLLEELGQKIQQGSLCGLGQTIPNPVLTTLKYFRHEYEAHIREKVCPAKQCKSLIHYEILADMCRGCGLCVGVCPANAITGEKRKTYHIDRESCIRCGLCINSCKFAAIEVGSAGMEVTA